MCEQMLHNCILSLLTVKVISKMRLCFFGSFSEIAPLKLDQHYFMAYSTSVGTELYPELRPFASFD